MAGEKGSKRRRGKPCKKSSDTHKHLWQNGEFARMMFESFRKKPNKPEKQLTKLIKENNLPFIYVGNGKIWFDRRNPDFVCNNGVKLIIELFGDHWHNKPGVAEKDKERIVTYAKYGYKTLVIWQHELKEPIQVIEKINNFLT